MHICILLYIHVTVLYYILASFQKIKMLKMLLFTMHAHMHSSLYTCNCTLLYSSFFSENKNVNVNVPKWSDTL